MSNSLTMHTSMQDDTDRFFREIAQIPLLSHDQEKELAARIAGGDEAAREQFILANMRLVVSIARRYVRETVPLEDLIQEGTFGLMRAVEKYDGRGRFSTYAHWWIKQTIIRGIDEMERIVRLPVHAVEEMRRLFNLAIRLESELGREPTNQELAEHFEKTVERVEFLKSINLHTTSLNVPDDNELTLEDLLEDPITVEDHIDQMAFSDEALLLRKALVTLSLREQDVLRRRYGIDHEFQVIERIARDYGVSKQRIQQIEKDAMRKLLVRIRQLQGREVEALAS